MSTHLLTPDEQFLIYYDKLRDEINRAYTHYEISKSLREFSHTRRAEFIEGLTFFQVTIEANLLATIMTIGKFIDRREDSLSLNSFFEFVGKHLDLFSSEAYKKRLLNRGMDCEDCDHWVKIHVDITAETIDLDKVKLKNLSIEKLRLWRHKKFAHIDEELVLKNTSIMKEKPITIQEIDDIITTLHEILNRYRGAYDGTEWIIGLPPVKHQIEHIMNTIKFHQQSRNSASKK